MKILLLSIFLLAYTSLWAQNGSTESSPLNQSNNSLANLEDNFILEAQNAQLAYPNPTNEKATVLIEEEFSSIHLKIVNTMGQTMLAKLEVEGQYYTFDLVDLVVGSYYILITIDGQTKSVAVVKE